MKTNNSRNQTNKISKQSWPTIVVIVVVAFVDVGANPYIRISVQGSTWPEGDVCVVSFYCVASLIGAARRYACVCEFSSSVVLVVLDKNWLQYTTTSGTTSAGAAFTLLPLILRVWLG